jgi:hypothetical protein
MQQAIIGGHGVVFDQMQSTLLSQRRNRFDITNAATSVARLEPPVKFGVAGAGIPPTIVERPVQTKFTAGSQVHLQPVKKRFHLRPVHDVHGIGGKDCRYKVHRPGLHHIQDDRSLEIGQRRLLAPGPNTGQILRLVRGLPTQVGQSPGEADRMLARPAANLKHTIHTDEGPGNNGQNRALVILTRLRERLFHQATSCQ